MSPVEQTEQAEQAHGSPGGGDRAESQPAVAGSLDHTGGNIDKIRDILFGANMRDYDARFLRLQEALAKETAELRENTRRRFETLEHHVNKEIEALHARLKTERDDRSDASSRHSQELKDVGDALGRKIRDLEDHEASVVSGLRQDALNQSRNLMDELQARHQEFVSLLEKRFHELQHGKTDRAALASLLTEVAMRLNGDVRIPGADR